MKIRTMLIAGTVACMALSGTALAQVVFTKVQVADRIRKVEDGVDEFRKWSEKRVEQADSRDPGRGSLTFRRRSSDRSFLNARFIRVVNTGADGWCSGFLSMVVDGRPFLTRVPMFPRKGIPSDGLQNFNRGQWANKTRVLIRNPYKGKRNRG